LRQMRLETKYLIATLSAVILVGGLYLQFLYDVPDAQEVTNTWVSWFLIILGIAGLIVSLVWKQRKNPLLAKDDAHTVVD